MHLTYRPASVADVEPCFGFLPAAFACDPELRERLPDVWRQWLRDGAMQLTVVEDQERPPGLTLVGFGSSVFVTEAFAAQARTSVPPPISARIAQMSLAAVSPVLTREAVRRANAGPGLNLLILHIGWASLLNAEEVRWVKAKILEAFFFTHSGYRINQVMQEIYSRDEMERGLAVGVLLLTDYGSFYDVAPSPETRAYLIGTTREEVRDGSMISPLFFYSPPRFSFTPGEQDLLRQALLGDADEELARALQVSLSTVHKRWHSIYERVTAVAPDLLPSSADPDRRRGAEKRRHLLSYLRFHLEELRPISR